MILTPDNKLTAEEVNLLWNQAIKQAFLEDRTDAQVFAELIQERIAAPAPLPEEVEAVACRHGWRGGRPENGDQIQTPCLVCGTKSLFIGNGGFLTCANVPASHGEYQG